MSLTAEQEKYLSEYLKTVGICTQEPFEEFYDHIATAFENSDADDLKEFVREEIQPSFGGVDGIKKIVKAQSKLRSKMIWKRAKEIYLGLFGWPALGMVILSFALLQTLMIAFGPKALTLFSIVVGLFLPALIVFYGFTKFYLDCRKQEKLYTASDLNRSILMMVHIPFTLINLFANLLIPITIGRKSFAPLIADHVWIAALISTLILLYGFTCLKLFKETFILKIQTV